MSPLLAFRLTAKFLVPVDISGTFVKDFNLTAMMPGVSTGSAYLRNHLVITQVVSSYDSGTQAGQEWVELYNPTDVAVSLAGWQFKGVTAGGAVGGCDYR